MLVIFDEGFQLSPDLLSITSGVNWAKNTRPLVIINDWFSLRMKSCQASFESFFIIIAATFQGFTSFLKR